MSSHRRIGAVVIAAALLGALVTHAASAVISTQAFCANIATGQSGFTDLAQAAPHQRNVECLKGSGITAGKTATTYAPQENVSRAQMATFIANMVDTANELDAPGATTIPDLPTAAAAGDHFTDDENTGGHEANINRLADAEIVSGQTATTYNPTGDVSRAQMATFIAQALDFIRGAPLAEGADRFTDDENTGGHEANINRLANADIVAGKTATTFSPTEFVSRAQMASFIVQAMADLHADGFITALPPNTQTIVLDPSGAVSNPTDNAAGDEVAFTASNIVAADVDLALFPCDNVTSLQPPYTFLDTNPDDGTADPSPELVEADIVSVNGTAQAANTEFVSAVPVTNGSISFTVDSPAPDCVVAVVWDDADDDDKVDLAASNQPTETFGATGQVTFVPPPAPSGTADEDVFSTNKAGDTFIGCEIGQAQGPPGAGGAPEAGPNAVNLAECFTFSYDGNDAYFIDTNGDLQPDGGQMSQAAFEQALSPGDDVSSQPGSYFADSASQSRFVLVDEAPAAPGGVSAASSGGTITVTFNEVAGADSYKVYRNQTNNPQPCPSFSPAAYTGAGTVAGGSADTDTGTTNSFTDSGLAPNTRYCYVVSSVDEGDEGSASSSANATTGPDTVPPQAVDTRIASNVGTPTQLSNNDEFQVCFNEDIVDPASQASDSPPLGDTESVRVRDADGTTATLTQGSGASFTRGASPTAGVGIVVRGADNLPCAANRVLNVRLTGFPAPSGGTDPTISFNSLDIIDAKEIEDLAGNLWIATASGQDVRIDEQPAA